jgi:holo-[acyl-carrier protein] synthase
MNIYGNGIDIIDITRMRSLITKNKKFKERIFTKKEIKSCEKIKNKFACYAKKFAAKEAFTKALGTGVSNGLSLNEIEINNNHKGKPFLELKNKSYRIVKMTIKKNFKVYLSLSDEKNYAVASVIIVK